ncbi:MAG: ABC transporter permease [Proteobacteria bacterium]|nr:ABC transporter permease [Pseudomonadota bacterium]
MLELFDIELFASGIRLATPLILAALGGMFSERAGVVNIALDGIMIFGAFAGAVIAYETGNPWVGLLGAVIVGALIAHIHGVASIRYRADQVVSGTAINLLAIGVPAMLANGFYDTTSSTPNIEITIPKITLPLISHIPYLDILLGKYSFMVYFTFLLVPLSWFILFRTSFGLRLRSVGENPEAADTAGVNVYLMRYYGVWISGIMAGLGGAFLSIAHGSSYVRSISAGRGFIALAALIFGRYNPFLTLLGCLMFGIADAFQIRVQGVIEIPTQFVQMFPYILTMIILAGFIGKSQVPAADGVPYVQSK